MIPEITIEVYLSTGGPLIDVRSPGEYRQGHIPGAVNIPLFTDEERAMVGTLYTRVSPEKALETGLELVAPKLGWFLEEARSITQGGAVTVHCWRGGQRSRSFAGHLASHGFRQVSVIAGGYKAYRQLVHRYFENPPELRILGGFTGSGKTEIIGTLAARGYQTVDLEGVACHKGSSFGAIGCGDQPTTEQFENDLFGAFRPLDASHPVWLEDESHNIGGVNLPMPLWQAMQKSPTWFLRIPREVRASWLVREYAAYGPGVLEEATRRITRRLGGDNSVQALKLISAGHYRDAALILLAYYDKSYEKALRLHTRGEVREILLETIDPEKNATIIIDYEEGRRSH
jgi:tRNA 2-selenouridine synthase